VAGKLPDGDPWPVDNKLAMTNSGQTFHAYVHIPFCEVRCGYCDFNTYTASEIGPIRRDEFHSSLINEIEFSRRFLKINGYTTQELSSIFFGGGTPTLFSVGQISVVMDSLNNAFGISNDAEVTVEANPDTVSGNYLDDLAKSGVNRISFGVQSFDSNVLKVLDRTHNPIRVPEVVELARGSGLRVSIDLIFGTPGESLDSWKRTVLQALELGAEHISAYALIVEPGTKLERAIRSKEVEPVDEDLLADKYEWASQIFEDAGLPWYEISNWGNPSLHNRAYWKSSDWWGYGPGAHSHIGGTRWWNRKHPLAYKSSLETGSPAQALEILPERARLEERLLLELRTIDGVENSVLEELGVHPEKVASYLAQGLVELLPNQKLRVTKLGRLLADGIVLELLSGSEA
jgi:putative oxygen-independent coproporphyrinogen III oxidase